ncbi:MAG TPA: cytochrome P450, partial [Myxococcota bacterium]|nr:cytochrome P450 [Myxococcota bacterium]
PVTQRKPPVESELGFDPLDTSKTKDPARMERIRRECPVFRPTEGIVFTSRYGDTGRVFRDAKTFSALGDMRAPGVVVPEEERFLGEIDAPLHPRIRRVLLKGFTRKGARDAEPWTRGDVRRRIGGFAARGGGDLMQALAIPLPGAVSAHVLGLPDALHDPVMQWCDELLHSSWPATGRTPRGVGIAGAFPEFAAVLDEQIRRRQPGGDLAADDLLTLMVQARDDDGWQIAPEHVRTLTVNILAGSLSASYMLGNLLYRWITDAGFERALREDRGRIAKAVEESLRFEAPVTFLMRTALEDTEIGGCPVHKGEHVMMGIASANRDEATYERADEFRLDREDPPEHLAFGSGAHLCLGNHLTRMVGRVVLEEMQERFAPGALRLAPGWEWRCVAHIQEYGPETLDVVVG